MLCVCLFDLSLIFIYVYVLFVCLFDLSLIFVHVYVRSNLLLSGRHYNSFDETLYLILTLIVNT